MINFCAIITSEMAVSNSVCGDLPRSCRLCECISRVSSVAFLINFYIFLNLSAAILSKIKDSELGEAREAAIVWLKDAPWRKQDDGSRGRREKQ
jgi:hypothetical protein